MKVYTRKIGMRSMLEAELWEILEGIQIAWEKGLNKVILKLDCVKTVNILKGWGPDQGLLSLRANEIMQWMGVSGCSMLGDRGIR